MNDIRFIKQLGDNLEEVARRNTSSKRPGPGRARRSLTIALALLATVTVGVAAAKVLNKPDKPESFVASSIACYGTSNFSEDNSTSYVDAEGQPPVKTCAKVRANLNLPPAKLIACTQGQIVAVFPGRDCSKAGLEPLPASYRVAVDRYNRLDRAIRKVEGSSNCIPADVLAEKARAILQNQGWEGWRVVVRNLSGNHPLPCGFIRMENGNGSRSISGALNTDESVLWVFYSNPR